MRFQEKLFCGIIDRRKEYKREMEKTNRKYQAYIQILKEELHPAMGCTEPIALAYAAAVARRELGCLPDRVVIGASGSIIKNVKSVIVPNTNHLKGIPAAVSAGIVAGDPDKELEVIAEATEEDSAKIKDFLENTPITVEHLDQGITFDIVLTLYHGDEYAKVRIANYHTNIVLIEHNGEVVKESEVKGEEEEGLTDRSLLNMKDIWDFINTVDVEEIKEVLDRQMEYNYTIAKEGIRGDYGANIGKVLLDMDDDNVKTRAKAMAAAGSDARMNGCELPVVINSGSGNQGITVSVPVMVYAEELNVEKEKLYRALALSNLTAIHETLMRVYGQPHASQIYKVIKSKTYPLNVKTYKRQDKMKRFSDIIFENAEVENPGDFVEFLDRNKDKTKNLNSMRAAVIKEYGNERGMKYYTLFKPHFKVISAFKD